MPLALLLNVFKLPLDYVLVVAAAVTAYFVRFHTTLLTDARPVQYVIPFEDYVVWAFLYGVLMVAIFAILRLYTLQRRKFMEEFFTIIAATSWGILGGVFLMFFARQFIASRFILVALWVLTILYVVVGRVVVRSLRALLYKLGYGSARMVIVGHSSSAVRVQQKLTTHATMGYCVVSVLPSVSEQSLKVLQELHNVSPLDRVLVIDGDTSRNYLNELLEWCDQHHVILEYSADRFDAHTPHLEQETFCGIPLVRVMRTPLEGWGKVVKRIFDIIGSCVLLVLLAPLLLLIAVCIKLDSRGPVFFTRRDDGSPSMRIGQYGRKFCYFKFRSMVVQSDSLRYSKFAALNMRKGPLVKIKNDPRVTRVGRILRRFSLDE